MLVRCSECSQVVEVSTLSEHLVMECEHRELFIQCAPCTESVKISGYDQHSLECIGLLHSISVTSGYLLFLLPELREGCNRCCLCHGDIEDEENCWHAHLMGEKPCPKSTRAKLLPKQVKIKD